MKFKTIAVVGLGLMGGSLAAACRKKFPETRVIGVSRNRKAIQQALQNRWIHRGTYDLAQGVRDADLVVLCAPVDTLEGLLLKINAAAKPGALVTDAGSVKGPVAQYAEAKKFRNIRFVGAHPMTGSHKRGVEAARPDLYERGFVFVTRSSGTDAAAFEAVKLFWNQISPRVVEIYPEKHDAVTAQISHLPHLIAACLVLSVQPEAFRFAGPGFMDATRIAQGHPSIWLPIFQANRREILKALSRFEAELKRFRFALKGSVGVSLTPLLKKACARRSQISL